MDSLYMNEALIEAKKAINNNEVPVGAIIVYNNKIIARAYNCKKNSNDVINHAEILAIKKAAKVLKDWRLSECEMYVTLEPCPMCAGAILQSRIKKVYIGASSNIKSNKKIIDSIFHNSEYNHYVECKYCNNIECSRILSAFFQNKR